MGERYSQRSESESESEVRVRGQRSKVRCPSQRSEVEGQRSKVRESEVRGRMAQVPLGAS